MKTLSIIGIILSVLAFICAVSFMSTDPTSSIGWGMYAEIYLLALSITALVKANKK